MRYMLITIMVLLNACAYNPIVDTAGRSGTFNKSKAVEMTNDIQHCKTLAKEHSSPFTEAYKRFYNYYLRAGTFYLADKMEYDYPNITRKCLSNRGHSVLN
jgi:hypothetical protein|tara:strand:- start:4188 stop:4490 length:303 start_codon:yes stop_codon:yes gene_type:complete